MAYKKDIKPLLKELGYTWEQMQAFWDECIEINWKVGIIAKSGKNWNDLTIGQICTLPSLKETTLRQQKEKEEEETRKLLEEQKKKDDEKYYWEHFDEIMVEKIEKGEALTEKELKTLVFECNEIEREEGENRRWSRSVESIIELCGRYFAVVWEEGLTEYQDNEFYDQPYEVEEKTYEKKITVTEWVKKKGA